tara:strand:- start:959 stop:2158 length:1200 start_codon:yes stop_codon:yes gene_type:complete
MTNNKMPRFSNWREDLFEVVDDQTTEKKIKEKNIDNSKLIKINPDFKEAIQHIGGEIIEMKEMGSGDNDKEEAEKKNIASKQKRANNIKKQVLIKKLMAVRAGAEDVTAGYEPEGEVIGERLGGKGVSRKAAAGSIYPGKKGDGDFPDSDRGAGNKAKRRAGGKVEKKSPTYRAYVLNKEGSVYDDPEFGKSVAKARKLSLSKDPKDQKKGRDIDKANTKKMVGEAKVDKGRSDYGKASIRNYRRMGPGHDDPAMFDSSNKRGKTIDKRREEHKARRGVKGAKVPAYKVSEESGGEKVDGKFMSYATMKAKGIKPKKTALQSVKDKYKGQIYDPKKERKPSKVDQVKAAAERKKRQDADNKAYAARAKKAGFKSTQDYTNVVARYGGEDNYKKGRGLGT